MNDNLFELPVFLCCFWCGLCLGAVYDLLRIIRRGGRKFFTVIADISFGIVFFAGSFAVLMYADLGRMRPHNIMGIFFGILLWQRFPGSFIRRETVKLFGLIRKGKK